MPGSAEIEFRGGPFDQPEGQLNKAWVDFDENDELPDVYGATMRERFPDGSDGPPMRHTYERRDDEAQPYYEYVGAEEVEG